MAMAQPVRLPLALCRLPGSPGQNLVLSLWNGNWSQPGLISAALGSRHAPMVSVALPPALSLVGGP